MRIPPIPSPPPARPTPKELDDVLFYEWDVDAKEYLHIQLDLTYRHIVRGVKRIFRIRPYRPFFFDSTQYTAQIDCACIIEDYDNKLFLAAQISSATLHYDDLNEPVRSNWGDTKDIGDKLLFEHLSFELPPAGIVGVIGPNGAGKTTLFRLIMGIEKPDSGSIEIGETVKISYVDQQHRSIDPDKTVYETIAGNSEWVRMGGRDVNARAWVSRFNFSGADQEKLCGVLSGGERNRLHLALTLKDEGNVLLLDEPTNDVDVNTIRALEEGLDGFAGCAVVVSHDRWFLDRIATHILAYEGEGKVVFFEGNYQEYEANRKLRLGDAEPKRFKYKKLME